MRILQPPLLQQRRVPRVIHLDYFHSDHRAITAVIAAHDQSSHNPIDNVLNDLDACATTLQKWHIGKYGRMKKRVVEAQTRVNDLNNTLDRSNNIMEELKTSESILDDLLEQEEIYWQQQSQVEWMSSEWSFIQEVMRKMGFAEQWIKLIMTCLSTNTFSFNVNGEVSGSLTPTRGLRQGCPLSPYLFLICSEGLSRLLQFEENEGWLIGFKLTRNAAPISHLLFADDSLLFCHANESSCLAIKKVLDIYHRASGQLLNHDKSAIPTYIMSCFRLPAYVGNQLESMMANFWWGSNENGSKIHWRAWHLLCKSKIDGGMGFRSFEQFNQALLAKQAWRLLEKLDSLRGKLLKSRYFPHNDFLHAPHGHSPSLTWQGIVWGRELLLKGLHWKIGEGRLIRVALDPWIPSRDTFTPTLFSSHANAMVSHLITDERVWNVPLLEQWFSPLDVDRILTMTLSFLQHSDALVWHYTTSGAYTVQSGYHLATSIADTSANNCSSSVSQASWWKYFWSLQLPQKVKIFAWRVIHNALPVVTSLVRRKIITDSTCLVCKSTWESIGHALFGCKYAKAVWRHMDLIFDWSKASAMYKGDYLTPPTSLDLKLNVDAALDANRNIIGVGAVVRNSAGHALAPMAKQIIGNFASHVMEAKAMFHSLNWVIQLQLPITIVETDALLVANTLQYGSTAISSYHDILLDVTSLLSFFSTSECCPC
uniref:Reverse transcriptase domain-containing protein n=1 Tax=Cannabis sativa TaxID=3483 RepID=A0A803PPP4_CANSA